MSIALKSKLIDEVIKIEGGYVNDPADSGGETIYGITVAVARQFGYIGDMRKMPYGVAVAIYSQLYWQPLYLDVVSELAPTVAEELFDTSVNMGVGRAGSFLQRSLNALNGGGENLTVDGKVGPRTIQVLENFLRIRGIEGESVLFNMLNCLQGEFYINLCEQRPKDKRFIYGWFKNRVKIK